MAESAGHEELNKHTHTGIIVVVNYNNYWHHTILPKKILRHAHGAAESIPCQFRHGQGRVDGSCCLIAQSSARLIAPSRRLTAAPVPSERTHRRTRPSRPQRVGHSQQQRGCTPRSCRRHLAPCHLQRRPRRLVLLRVHLAACAPAVHVVARVGKPPAANVAQALVDKLDAPPVDRVEHFCDARRGEPVQQPLPSAGTGVRAKRVAVVQRAERCAPQRGESWRWRARSTHVPHRALPGGADKRPYCAASRHATRDHRRRTSDLAAPKRSRCA